jgi:hypothetical protein
MNKLYTDISRKAKEVFLQRCYEKSGKKHTRYWCVADERDFYVNKENEILVKEGLPIHYKEWQEETKETIEVDGKKYTRIVEPRRLVDIYDYAKQGRYAKQLEFTFEIFNLKYIFRYYNGMYIGDNYSQNEHIQMLFKMHNFNCFDKKIKGIKTNIHNFDLDFSYLGYKYKESKDLNDISIYILYDNYGWSNGCYYVVGLIDFLNIDYNTILKYAKNYISIFDDMGINLKKTSPEQRIDLFKTILELKTKKQDVIDSVDTFDAIKINPKTESENSVCYIIKNKRNDLYKIGYSKDPKNREKTLQSEEPEIETIKIFKNNWESVLHEKYKEQRVRGEWFDLSNIQVKYICTHFE